MLETILVKVGCPLGVLAVYSFGFYLVALLFNSVILAAGWLSRRVKGGR